MEGFLLFIDCLSYLKEFQLFIMKQLASRSPEKGPVVIKAASIREIHKILYNLVEVLYYNEIIFQKTGSSLANSYRNRI